MLRAAKPAANKIADVENLEQVMGRAKTILMADFKGMSVDKINRMRLECFKNQVQFRVAKNRIVRIVFDKLGQPDVGDLLTGSTGFWMGFDDPITPIKLVADFARENDAPIIKGCLLEGEFIGPERIEELKLIPPRDQLIAQVVGGIAAPLSGFVGVLNEIVRSFVGVLDSLSQKWESDDVQNEGLSATGGSVENVIEAIEKMTVLELVELKKALEEKFGVSAAAPMAMAAMPGAAGAPAEVQEEEQT